MTWSTALAAGFDGLLRPLTTPAHVIVLAGLALVAGGSGRPLSAGAVVIPLFASGLVIGLGALAWGVGESPAVDVLLAAAALCGLASAAGIAAPAAIAAPVALVSGVALGLDSPPDAIRLGDAAAMLIGTGCGGVAALSVMARAAAMAARWRHGIALRIAGSWIAAIAMMALAVRWGGDAGP